jgi:hypothetical protein
MHCDRGDLPFRRGVLGCVLMRQNVSRESLRLDAPLRGVQMIHAFNAQGHAWDLFLSPTGQTVAASG